MIFKCNFIEFLDKKNDKKPNDLKLKDKLKIFYCKIISLKI